MFARAPLLMFFSISIFCSSKVGNVNLSFSLMICHPKELSIGANISPLFFIEYAAFSNCSALKSPGPKVFIWPPFFPVLLYPY